MDLSMTDIARRGRMNPAALALRPMDAWFIAPDAPTTPTASPASLS